jgi:hypothetical protein
VLDVFSKYERYERDAARDLAVVVAHRPFDT